MNERDFQKIHFIRRGTMRSEKFMPELKKESYKLFKIQEGFDVDRAGHTDEILSAAVQESLPSHSEERGKWTMEFRMKRRLYELFIEYFFMGEVIPLKDIIGGMERDIILRTLLKVNGNQRKAARILRLKYTTLNEKIKKHNIRFRINPF